MSKREIQKLTEEIKSIKAQLNKSAGFKGDEHWKGYPSYLMGIKGWGLDSIEGDLSDEVGDGKVSFVLSSDSFVPGLTVHFEYEQRWAPYGGYEYAKVIVFLQGKKIAEFGGKGKSIELWNMDSILTDMFSKAIIQTVDRNAISDPTN